MRSDHACFDAFGVFAAPPWRGPVTMTPPLSRRGVLGGMSGVVFAAGLEGGGSPAGAAPLPESAPRVFDVRAFGARGDGIADDTGAFRAMHAAMRRLQEADDAARASDPRRPPVEFIIELPPGHYRYIWNRWTWGLRRVTVFGYGAFIQCMHEGPFSVDQAPLISNREHYWTWDSFGPAFGGPAAIPEDYGRRIRTARPGDQAVVLRHAGEGSAFRPGAWVMVQSYAQQQYGYPPNLRYFERAQVTAVEGAVIRLDRPLVHLHKEDWPEDASSATALGQARIVAIDRPDCPFALSQRFFGLTTLSNPNHAVAPSWSRTTQETLSLTGTLEAVVRDCTLIALGVSQVGSAHVEASTIAYTEPDKLIDRLSFAECRITSLQQCTGVNRLVLRGCTIGLGAQLNARDVTVADCDFQGATDATEWASGINLDGANPTRRMTLTGCRFFGRNDPTGRPFGGQIWRHLPIEGKELRPMDASRIAVAAGVPAYAALVDLLEEGWPVVVTDRENAWHVGRCTEIRGEGADAIFAFALPAPLEAGQTLSVPRLKQLTVQGHSLIALADSPPDPPFLTWGEEIVASALLRLELRSDFATRPAWLPGYPRRIRCRVTKPYAGPAPGCFLVLQEQVPAYRGLELAIDLSQPGEREVSRSGAKLLAGDRLHADGGKAEALPGARCLRVVLAMISAEPGGEARVAQGTEFDQAHFLLEVEVDSPFGLPRSTDP
jgi:hypothetical protein